MMARPMSGGRCAGRHVGGGGGFLDEDGGGDELVGRAQSADRKILARRAESGCRSTHPQERLCSPSGSRSMRSIPLHYTTRMLPAVFRQRARADRQDVHRFAARRARRACKGAMGAEQPGTRSAQALTIIAQNIDQAATGEGAICQDTGMPTFEVHVPRGTDQIWMRQQIREAVAKATQLGKLRPNSVDSITGENSGDNLGPGTPIIHFDQWEQDDIEVKLLLKGGGCENMNTQYSLPAELAHLGRADRIARRGAQVHPACGLERAGQRVRAGRGRRVHRRRSHVRISPRERAAVPNARRRQCRPAAGGARSDHHGDRQHARHRHDGVWRKRQPDRLQDRRAQQAAGQLLRVGGVRLLGVPAAGRPP